MSDRNVHSHAYGPAEFRDSGARLLAWARGALDAKLVQSTIEPAVADHQWELKNAKSTEERRQVVVSGRSILLRTLLAAIFLDWRRRALQPLNAMLAVPFFLVIVGAPSVSGFAVDKLSSAAQTNFTHAQLAFGLVGLLCGLAISSFPIQIRSARWPATLMVGLFAWTALFGDDYEGARRWLTVGSLHIHVAGLLAPVFVLSLGHARRRSVELMVVGSSLGLLVLQPNFGEAVLYALAAFVMLQRTTRMWALGIVLPLLAIAWHRDPSMGLDQQLPFDRFALGITAATLLLVIPAWALFRAYRLRGGIHGKIARGAAAMLVFGPLLNVAFCDSVPFVTYGGSAVVAYFCCVALICRGASSGTATAGSSRAPANPA